MTRTFKLGLIVALLALAGCAAQQAHRVQVWAPGRTLAELEQCAGKPTATDALGGGLSIAQWHYAEPNGNANIPVPLAVIATGVDAALDRKSVV